MTPTILPALIALAIKILLFAYALRSPLKGRDTRLYLVLLLILGGHNATEIFILTYYPNYGLDATVAGYGYAYFATLILFVAVVLHLSLRVSIKNARHSAAVLLIYVPVLCLEALLLFTDKLVHGFVAMNSLTIIREPGALYYLLETYVVVYLAASLANLIYGARVLTPFERVRIRWWLLALAPMASLMIYIMVARHFGLTHISSTIYVPITQTWFLLVSIYATYQYRLFEIEFYIPWSGLRKRKTELYRRIRGLIAEMAELPNIQQAVDHLATMFECPVALIGATKPIVAPNGTHAMTSLPVDVLKGINRMVIAQEFESERPMTLRTLRDHGVAAVVPFFPNNRGARGWLLLGNKFNDAVYNRDDIVHVERLFERLADLFLDRLLGQRKALTDAYKEIRTLRLTVQQLNVELSQIEDTLERERNEAREALAIKDALLSRMQMATQQAEWKNKSLHECIADYEAYIIRNALTECGGNKSEAARALGVKANTLHYKLLKHGIEPA